MKKPIEKKAFTQSGEKAYFNMFTEFVFYFFVAAVTVDVVPIRTGSDRINKTK